MMFGVFIEVDPGGADSADDAAFLQREIVPRVRDAGARAAYWLDGAGGSRSVALVVYESEDAAQAHADRMKVGETPPGAPDGHKAIVRSVEVRKVLASL
jgi:hypothetical protein